MNAILKMLFTALLLSYAAALKADSPLTSTEFWRAYEKEKIIKYTLNKGSMDGKIASFLMNDNADIGLRAAVCNALGWKFAGQDNARVFLQHLSKKYKTNGEDPTENFCAEDLALYGYLLAMDDYFHPENALPFLERAAEKKSKSLTIRMLHALVLAQQAMDISFCDVFMLVDEVEQDASLTADLSENAVGIIMEYIGLYQDDCD